MWMAPNGCPQAGDAFGEFDPRTVIRRVVANVDHGVNADGARLFQRLLGSDAVAQVQQMGVRIDQATGSGFSILGNSTSPRLVCVFGTSRPHWRALAQGALRSALSCSAILFAVSGRKGAIR